MLSSFAILALAATSTAHTIFQQLKVDGADQGSLTGIRVPTSNNPIKDVTLPEMACNKAFSQPVSNKVIDVKAGSTISAFWGHVIGGAQFPNDKDNPIASSHHGPIMTYLAKVDNAASVDPTGLKWFKIQQDGKDAQNKWGVDRLYAAKGWYDFKMPECIAPGQYLMRHEILALHSAAPDPKNGRNYKEYQVYVGCAQIKVSGSGTFSPSSTVSFPGAYKASDPGIDVQIWGKTNGVADMDGKPYIAPGPDPIKC